MRLGRNPVWLELSRRKLVRERHTEGRRRADTGKKMTTDKLQREAWGHPRSPQEELTVLSACWGCPLHGTSSQPPKPTNTEEGERDIHKERGRERERERLYVKLHMHLHELILKQRCRGASSSSKRLTEIPKTMQTEHSARCSDAAPPLQVGPGQAGAEGGCPGARGDPTFW